jgi:prepilin-type N-terminal cleavage/methylation domain-containing protein
MKATAVSRMAALKGRYPTAQGEALGIARHATFKSLKGRDRELRWGYSALSGLQGVIATRSQGCALGYHISAFHADARRRSRTAIRYIRMRRLPQAPVRRLAFTLLEVILALAILAGALAVLGEVMRLADQTASLTEGETHAQILAASLMDELASGARQLSAVSQASLDANADPPWLYSVSLEDTGFQELVGVRVLVEQQLDPRLQPARFELVRWMANPDYVPPETGEESNSSTSSSASGSSSSLSTSGSGGIGGQP